MQMESTSEGKERMDALSKWMSVVVVFSSGVCFFRVFLFISFVFFEFGFCGPFRAQIVGTTSLICVRQRRGLWWSKIQKNRLPRSSRWNPALVLVTLREGY